MDPMTIGALAGVAMGMLKGQNDQAKAESQKKVSAVTAQYSPWTKMQAAPVQQPDTMGSMMQGGIAGAMTGAQFGKGGAPASGAELASNGPQTMPQQPYGMGQGMYPDQRTYGQQYPWMGQQ